MNSARVEIVGNGLVMAESDTHPAGTLFSGGYDAELNTLFLASVMGHPEGVQAAGGDPSKSEVSGLRVFKALDSKIYWMDDSMSLPRKLTQLEQQAVAAGLRAYFRHEVEHASKLSDVP